MIHSSFAQRGGAESYVRNLSRALTARGHEVRVYCRQTADPEPGEYQLGRRFTERLGSSESKLGKVLVHLGDLLDPTGLHMGKLREFEPDVVHVHNWQGLGALPVALLSRRYPTCHTTHDYALCDPDSTLTNPARSAPLNALRRIRSACLGHMFRRVVFLWPAGRTRDIVYRHVPRAARLTGHVMPLAVPQDTEPSYWGPGRSDEFLYLGALTPHKGIDMLLDAWRAVAQEIDATLVVAGEGVRRNAVEAAARSCPSIRYAGFLDHAGKVAALQHAGWLVFPSQCLETFGISCLEALQATRPIISSTTARPQIASDSSLLTFDGSAELSVVLRRAARLPREEYQRMAASAAADGRSLDWDNHLASLERIYESIAGRQAVHAE
jgi:glycosyltransferase involved in cell wall biosynthesis